MTKNEMPVDWKDHRSIGVEIDLGGTTRIFEMELIGGDRFRRRVKVGSLSMQVVKIEQLFRQDSWFEVSYDNGAKVSYDQKGNLQRLVVPVAAFFAGLPEESQGELKQELLETVAEMLSSGIEITVDVDLRGGIEEGDGRGWVQVSGNEGVERTGPGIGGFDIGPEKESKPFELRLDDNNDEFLTRVFLWVDVVEDGLFIALGDGDAMLTSVFYLSVDPEAILGIRTPAGAVDFLGKLRPSNDED